MYRIETSYERLQEALKGNPEFLGQYSNETRTEIATRVVYLAKTTQESYYIIRSMEPLDTIDSLKKNTILQELKDQNDYWTNYKVPGSIPLFFSCFPVPVTSTLFHTQAHEEYYKNEPKWLRVVYGAANYILTIALITTTTTAGCFVVAPFYDVAKSLGYGPIQEVPIDLQAVTEYYVIKE